MKKLSVGLIRPTMPCEFRSFSPEGILTLRDEIFQQYGFEAGFMAETGLGSELDFTDSEWMRHKVAVLPDRRKIFEWPADVIIHFKEPAEKDIPLYRPGQEVICFLHQNNPANIPMIRRLIGKRVILKAIEEICKPALYEMSKRVGVRMPEILRRCFRGGDWRKENIFFFGARGAVCRHSVSAILSEGVSLRQMYFCDLMEGLFSAADTPVRWTGETFSSANEEKLMKSLALCRIHINGALGPDGRAPKFFTQSHYGVVQDGTLLVNVNCDEGTSIVDEMFQLATFWDNPVYSVSLGTKMIGVSNVHNLPGAMHSSPDKRTAGEISFVRESSRLLEAALLPSLVETLGQLGKEVSIRQY